MQNVGKRIKELRRKRDLTQEKLADYLCVSYQAVSKWECGVANPDITMIGPLTKVLGVTADELLGLVGTEDSDRRAELEAAYRKTWNTGDIDRRTEVVEELVSEFPKDIKYRMWLGDCCYMNAFKYEGQDRFRTELEKAVSYFETVIEEAEQGQIKNSAIFGIVLALNALGRNDEGMKYVELYPDNPGLDKAEVMEWCLEGKAREKKRQEIIDGKLERLIGSIQMMGVKYGGVSIGLVKLMIPDGNYLYYHTHLCRAYIHMAMDLMSLGDHDGAVTALQSARYHAVEFDRMCNDEGIHRYTSPYLNLVEIDTKQFCRSGTSTELEDFRTLCSVPQFDSPPFPPRFSRII